MFQTTYQNEILFFTTGFTPRIPLVFHITCCNPTVTQQKKHGDFRSLGFNWGVTNPQLLGPCIAHPMAHHGGSAGEFMVISWDWAMYAMYSGWWFGT